MGFCVEVNFLERISTQTTEWSDYITLTYYIIANIIFFLLLLIIYIKRKTYRPLRMKHTKLITLMIIAAIIHTLAVFIGNDHFSILGDDNKPVPRFVCFLFNFLLPYLFALNIWFYVLNLRLIIYGYTIKISRAKPKYIKKMKFILFILIFVPLFIILFSTFFKNSISYDEEFNRCESSLLLKILIIGNIIYNVLILMFNLYRNRKAVNLNYFDEFVPVKNIIKVGTIIIIINISIVLFGLISYSLARSIYTSLIITLYLYSIIQLIGKEIYYSLSHNYKYAKKFDNKHKYLLINKLTSMKQMQGIDVIMNDFFNFCSEKNMLPDGFNARHAVTLLKEIKVYKTRFIGQHKIDNSIPKDHFQTIYKNFLGTKQSAVHYVQLEEQDELYTELLNLNFSLNGLDDIPALTYTTFDTLEEFGAR